LIEKLEQWDRELFLWLNGKHSEWLDQAMFYMTDKLFWIPVYILLLVVIYRAFGFKNTIWTVVGVALVITFCDRVSVEFFKEVFQRYRPTHNLEIKDLVHKVNGYGGGKYGFVSSHAANFFGIAFFLFPILKKAHGFKALWLFPWVIFISYTRIYLGVHYPGDIIGGAILGALIGHLIYLFFKKFFLFKE